jgi:hypothetical protein
MTQQPNIHWIWNAEKTGHGTVLLKQLERASAARHPRRSRTTLRRDTAHARHHRAPARQDRTDAGTLPMAAATDELVLPKRRGREPPWPSALDSICDGWRDLRAQRKQPPVASLIPRPRNHCVSEKN